MAFAYVRVKRTVVFAVSAILIGCALGFVTGASLHAKESLALSHNAEAALVILEEDATESSGGMKAIATLCFEDGSTAHVLCMLDDESSCLYGQHMKARVSLSTFNWETDSFHWSEGVCCRARLRNLEPVDPPVVLGVVAALRERAIRLFSDSGDAGALLQALVCGYRKDLKDSALYGAYQSCGLAHLVAVSGAHLIIVTSLFAVALNALKLSRRLSVVLLVFIMGAYLAFSGAPVSALRAAVMSSVGILSFFGKRRPSASNALGTSMVILVTADPSAALSASFTLSALSTLGIVMFMPLVKGYINRGFLASVPVVSESLALTLSASMLSLPYSCSLFSQLPLLSLVANVACAPLVPAACAFGLGAALFGSLIPDAGTILLPSAMFFATCLNACTTALSSVPYACVPEDVDTTVALLFTGAIAVTLWVVWPTDTRKVCAYAVPVVLVSICFCVLQFAAMPRDAVVMLDVGQGDAFLVRSGSAAMLVDTGELDSQLLAQLGKQHIVHLDCVCITHADTDHCGSLDALSRAVDVDTVILAEGITESDAQPCRELVEQTHRTAREVRSVTRGDKIALGAFTFEVIWPEEPAKQGDNAESLCLIGSYDGDDDGVADVSLLFTGDAERDQLEAIASSQGLQHVDILKVGHHGSKNALTDEQLDLLTPTIALIGVGAHNRYGHPAQVTLDQLEKHGCTVYRSDEDGQVSCQLSASGISVKRLQ